MSSKYYCVIDIRGAFYLQFSRLTFLSDRDGGEWRGGGRPSGPNRHRDYQNTHRDKHTQRETEEEGAWACKSLDYTVQTSSCRGFILKVLICSLHTALVRKWSEDVACLSVICLIMWLSRCLIKPVLMRSVAVDKCYLSECMVRITSATMFDISQILHSLQNIKS